MKKACGMPAKGQKMKNKEPDFFSSKREKEKVGGIERKSDHANARGGKRK